MPRFPLIPWLGIVALATLACRPEASAPAYQVVPVERRDLVVATSASGLIQPDTIVQIKSKTSGELLRLGADEGQDVAANAVIAEIDQRIPKNDLAQVQAALEVAKARSEQAALALKRADQLFAGGSIAKQEHDSVALVATDAKATMLNAQLDLDNAKIALDNTIIRAPISGVILTRSVQRGQIVASPSGDVNGGTLIFTMADMSHLQVQTEVDEIDIGRLVRGVRAKIAVPAFPQQAFEGSVLKVEPLADTVGSVTRFKVAVRIDNPGRHLIAGMKADVEFELADKAGVLAVPRAALDVANALGARPLPASDSGMKLLVVNRKGLLAPIKVKTGISDLDYTEVVDGLGVGDSVLVLAPRVDDKQKADLKRRLAL